MRDLKRNQRKMHYSLYIEQENESDFDVLDTVAKYSAPVEFKASLTAGKSDSGDSPFGKDISYDRIISTVKKDLWSAKRRAAGVWATGASRHQRKRSSCRRHLSIRSTTCMDCRK